MYLSILVADYLKEYQGELPVIGLRINPVVGAGDIAMMSTAAKQSKFGLPLLEDTQDRIGKIFKVIRQSIYYYLDVKSYFRVLL